MSRLALAVGGAAALVAAAVAACAVAALIGGPRGVLGGLLVYGAVFGACGLVFRRPRRVSRPVRPAGDVTLTKPRPVASLPR